MKKYYFLGQAANYSRKERLAHTFCIGLPSDSKKLCQFLAKKYQTTPNHVALTKNGRSALTIALQFTLPKGSKVVINGFTCYAVYEAVKAAKMKPVFADIDEKTLHFNAKTLKKVLDEDVKAIIIQNTLGIPADIEEIEKIAKKNNLKIFEDLAHCTGIKYADGREAGTIGVATALSFGKEKSIDTISGGAIIFRDPLLPAIKAPHKLPKFSDTFRARFYPLFGAICRGLKHIKLDGALMRVLLKLKWVERSADNKLDTKRRPAHFEAKLALKQLKAMPKNRKPIREFMLVNNREEALKKLHDNNFFFDGLWYEKPVSPERYYKKVRFNETECPVATKVAQEIINLPTYYSKKELEPARKILKEFQK